MKGYIFRLNLSINTVGIGTHADTKIMGLLALEYVIIEKFTIYQFTDGKGFYLENSNYLETVVCTHCTPHTDMYLERNSFVKFYTLEWLKR